MCKIEFLWFRYGRYRFGHFRSEKFGFFVFPMQWPRKVSSVSVSWRCESTLTSVLVLQKQIKPSPTPASRVRNSNEQLASDDDERAPLTTLSNGPSAQSRSQPSIIAHTSGGGVVSRFGFKPRSTVGTASRIPDSNSNITGATSSVDSLDSYAPGGRKAPRPSSGLLNRHQGAHAQRPTCMSIGDAFAPAQMARWRMIDDSDTGTLTSMSLSPSTPSDAVLKLLTGESQRNLDTNGNMNTDSSSNLNEPAVLKQSKPHTDRKPYSRIPNVGTGGRVSKLQRPSAGSAVTTTSSASSSSGGPASAAAAAPGPAPAAAVVAEQQGLNENNNKAKAQQQPQQQQRQKPRKFVGGWFGKRLSSQDSKSSQLQKEKSQPQKDSKNKSNLSKSNTQPPEVESRKPEVTSGKAEVGGVTQNPPPQHHDSNLNESEGCGEAMADPAAKHEEFHQAKPAEPPKEELHRAKEPAKRPTTIATTTTTTRVAPTGGADLVIETEVITGPVRGATHAQETGTGKDATLTGSERTAGFRARGRTLSGGSQGRVLLNQLHTSALRC